VTRSLRDKVKTLPPAAFEAMAQAAEIAIEDIRGDFLAATRQGLIRLQHLLATSSDRPPDWEIEAFRIAHDIKGQGTSFGYDLLTRIAASLCQQLLSDRGSEASNLHKRALAHCEAMRVLLDKDIRGMGGAYGERLLSILTIQP
jgi:chemotaxis protein histidine kinase CheA